MMTSSKRKNTDNINFKISDLMPKEVLDSLKQSKTLTSTESMSPSHKATKNLK